jgi:hypothetical protein
MRRLLFTSIMALALLGPAAIAQSPANLIQPSDIRYLGAFRLGAQAGNNYDTWDYGNGALAYYPNGDGSGPADGHPGSLFVTGHVYRSFVAEVEIPKPVNSRTVSSLPVARVLQPMVDVTAGLSGKNGFIMNMTYIPSQDRIYFTHGQDYSDGDCGQSGSPPGLGSFRPTLSSPQAQGLWFIGSLAPFTSLRYLMEVPASAASFAGGHGLASGRHRGWCPEGTNLYASTPWTAGSPPAPGSQLPYKTLMQFGSYDEKARWSKEHSPANAYQGGAWLTSGAKSAVVISGVIDADPSRSYYGYADWKLPSQCDPNPAANGCSGGRGWRAAAPQPALLLYRPEDLGAVADGRADGASPQWYAKLDLTPYMFRRYPPTLITTSADMENILVTYDRGRGLIYITESFVDGNKPVVHVFQVGSGGGTTTPPPPTPAPGAPGNVRVIR